MTVTLETAAAEDLDEACLFYERSDPGSGWYFLERVGMELGELARTGGSHRRRGGLHACPSNRFPDVFCYLVEGSSVRVAAVLDGRRDPAFIRKVLEMRK